MIQTYSSVKEVYSPIRSMEYLYNFHIFKGTALLHVIADLRISLHRNNIFSLRKYWLIFIKFTVFENVDFCLCKVVLSSKPYQPYST